MRRLGFVFKAFSQYLLNTSHVLREVLMAGLERHHTWMVPLKSFWNRHTDNMRAREVTQQMEKEIREWDFLRKSTTWAEKVGVEGK